MSSVSYVRPISWRLYWVTTEEHTEDWFVVATSARRARAEFEDYSGFDRGDAQSELVCQVPTELVKTLHPEVVATMADLDLVQAVGGVVVARMPSVVRFGEREYVQGPMDLLLTPGAVGVA